ARMRQSEAIQKYVAMRGCPLSASRSTRQAAMVKTKVSSVDSNPEAVQNIKLRLRIYAASAAAPASELPLSSRVSCRIHGMVAAASATLVSRITSEILPVEIGRR